MKEVLLIPKDRINVLNEETIKTIEKEVRVKISIKENIVEIEGEGLNLFQAKNIIKAIGRGFSPLNALKLLEDKELEIIDIPGKNIKRIKSRIIGTRGKTRKFIEEMTGCCLSVYGKTVSIIGNYEELGDARKAIEMFIKGASHSSVYRFLGKSEK